MIVRFLRQHMHWTPGDTTESLPRPVASLLIERGIAEEVTDGTKAVTEPPQHKAIRKAPRAKWRNP